MLLFFSLATEIVAEEAPVDKVCVCLFCGVCCCCGDYYYFFFFYF